MSNYTLAQRVLLRLTKDHPTSSLMVVGPLPRCLTFDNAVEEVEAVLDADELDAWRSVSSTIPTDHLPAMYGYLAGLVSAAMAYVRSEQHESALEILYKATRAIEAFATTSVTISEASNLDNTGT